MVHHNCPHHAVLVAHNGFEFDCPLLFAEIERTAGLDILENIYFSDTLFCLRQVRYFKFSITILINFFVQKRDKIDFLKDQSLGLKSIHTLCFPDKPYNGMTCAWRDSLSVCVCVCLCVCVCVFHTAHRAMPDVEAMEEVLQHPQVSCIQEALVHNQRPASEMLSTWSSSKRAQEKEREQANNKATDTQ